MARLEADPVEALGQLDEGGVAARLDPGEDVLDGRHRAGAGDLGMRQVGGGVTVDAAEVEALEKGGHDDRQGTWRLRGGPSVFVRPTPSAEPGGKHGVVSARAELSSVATAVDELATRVAAIADGLTGAERDALLTDLAEVERSLGNAARRLNRALGGR